MSKGLNERERRVCDLIRGREAALVEDLRLHVGLPTGGRNVAALDETRERLCGRAAALGARVETVPGVARPEWLYGEVPGRAPLPTAVCRRNGGGGKELLIAGHLDTVHDPAGTFRELVISADGSRATGPGCVDMKGGLVIALAALEVLEEAGEKLSWTLLLNSDEETGSYHSRFAIEDEAARVAGAGGLGIALETASANGGLVVERAGSGQFMYLSLGKAAHVGRDFAAGISAVDTLCRVVLDAHALSSPDEGIIVNIGPIEGGIATNVVPDRARAWGNVRYPTAEAARKLEDDLISIAGKYTKHPPPPHVICYYDFIREAKPLTPEVQAFAEMCRGCAEDLGQKLPFAKTAGVCDGNIMQAAGLTTIDTLGVRGGGLHTPEEWIEMGSLVERCQLLAVVMMRVGAARDESLRG